MTRGRLWLAMGAAVLSGILAFFLRDVMYTVILIPFAYLLWLIQSIYSLIPQIFLWVLVLIGMTILTLVTFVPEGPTARRRVEGRRRTPGQVEALAAWFARKDRGNYFKWQIANRLGLIAKEWWRTDPGGNRSRSDNSEAEKYLDAGLNTSFVDYPPRKNRYQKYSPTALDLDPGVVVDYLESQMETSRGRHP